MLGLFRVLFGFVLACLVAASVKVAFVITPEELMSASDQQWLAAFQLVLLVATQTAVFSAPFALLAVVIGEWQGIRSWSYYVLVGVAIAAAGFAALYSGETAGQPTIINRYALFAYFSAGVSGGVIYWLFSGLKAGGRRVDDALGRNRNMHPVSPRGSTTKPVLPAR